MRIALTRKIKISLPWEGSARYLRKGTVLNASTASNLPDYESKGLLWLDHPAVDNVYGVYVERDEYRILGQ